jgi:hypothetical protein
MAARLVQEDGPVRLWELIGSGDAVRLEAMLGLYARLFPQYAHYIPRMRRRAKFAAQHRPGHIVHYWLMEVEGKPAGIRTFRYIRARRCGIAVALAIDPAYREVTLHGQRLSLHLIQACLNQVLEDARQLGDPAPLGMVNEVEYPRLMEHYKHYGIIELPVRYIEPVFPPEQEDRPRREELALINFLPTSLGFLPNPALNGRAYNIDEVPDFALAFLVDHYGLPADHPQVQAALRSIPITS